jgi:hypothetical protein
VLPASALFLPVIHLSRRAVAVLLEHEPAPAMLGRTSCGRNSAVAGTHCLTSTECARAFLEVEAEDPAETASIDLIRDL